MYSLSPSFFNAATNSLANDGKHFQITDNRNNIIIVQDLKAFYAGKGQWMGKRPEEIKESLRFEYIEKNGNTDSVELFFNDLKSLTYDVRVNDQWIFRYIFEMKDGTTLTLSSENYEEKNINGEIILSKILKDKKCVAFYWSDIPIDLSGFKGKVQKNDQVDDFYIGLDYVKEILFDIKNP